MFVTLVAVLCRVSPGSSSACVEEIVTYSSKSDIPFQSCMIQGLPSDRILSRKSRTSSPSRPSTLNSWEDRRVVNWVKETAKKKLVMAGLWTEVCLQMPVLSASADGYEVYFLTNASGGASREAHDMAVLRMTQAGATPITTWSYVSVLQRDWAREETAGEVTKLFEEHGGGFGQGLRWEWQLLGLKEGTR
jgi:nicotinamidase-related amidase